MEHPTRNMEPIEIMDNFLSYEVIEAIGALAGILTTLAFAPQVVKSFRSKSVEDISLVMYAGLCTGILLWICYGALIGSRPLMAANGITLVLAGSVLYLRLRYAPKKERK